jgi:dihydroorotase
VLLDPAGAWTVDPQRMASAGRNTPFRGRLLPGRVVATFYRGRATVLDGELAAGEADAERGRRPEPVGVGA